MLQINSGFEVYDKFFSLSPDIKKKYVKKDGNTPNGWDELERERCIYNIIICFILDYSYFSLLHQYQ